MSFIEFCKLTPEERDWLLYVDLQKQKSDLKWYVTIVSGIISTLFYFGKEFVKMMFSRGSANG